MLKWVGMTLCLLTAVALVLSGWYSMHKIGRTYAVGIASGRFRLIRDVNASEQPRWIIENEIESPCWVWTCAIVYPIGWFIPLWMPLGALAIPTATLWLLDQRVPENHCRNCGYNLTGNVSGVCPECGTQTRGLETDG
jgi:hypothetical protein